MATQTAKRCKTCNAPVLSTFEKERGKCTACLRAERMAAAANVVENVTKAKPAKQPAPRMLTNVNKELANDVNSVNTQEQGGSAYTELIAVRVTRETQANILDYLKRTNQTKAHFLRAAICKALTG